MPEIPFLADMVASSLEFRDIKTALNSVIDASFAAAETYAQHFKEFQSIYEFGLSWRAFSKFLISCLNYLGRQI